MNTAGNASMHHDPHSGSEKKLAAFGWGLFFVWVGAAILAGVPGWGTLLGIAIITLGVQAGRRALGLRMEGFWLAAGLLFLLGGVWGFFGTTIPLLPVLLIVAGALVLVSILGGRDS